MGKWALAIPAAIALVVVSAGNLFFSCGHESGNSKGSETSPDTNSEEKPSEEKPSGEKPTTETDPDTTGTSCTLTENTTVAGNLNSNGCGIITRDTSSCQADRTAQGLSGFWLKFSCRVTLTKSGSNVVIAADSQPDYKSPYFGSTHVCYEQLAVTGRRINPNKIAAQSISMTVPFSPTTTGSPKAAGGGVIGISVPGVSIYGNTAAPGDSIYEEVETFDKCEGHPDNKSRYHFHTEPPSISSSDYAFIGVMRDGFPVYGRSDLDGSTPTLDAAGGHTGVTPDSNGASVYHYHVNYQTDGTSNAYFISKGYYAGTIGSCTGCQ